MCIRDRLLYLEENYGLTSEKKVQSAIKGVCRKTIVNPGDITGIALGKKLTVDLSAADDEHVALVAAAQKLFQLVLTVDN